MIVAPTWEKDARYELRKVLMDWVVGHREYNSTQRWKKTLENEKANIYNTSLCSFESMSTPLAGN